MDIREILAQPYRHFARGCRLHAFRSADGKYVLKTLTTEREIVEWFASDGLRLIDVPWAAGLGETDTARCIALQRDGLRSAALAWAELPSETGMIHLQAAPTGQTYAPVDLGPGFAPLAPAHTPYILQHHADLAGPFIAARMTVGDEATARRALDDVIGLLLIFAGRGVASETLNFLNNCGYVDGRMVMIDVGELVGSRERVLEQARTKRVLECKSFRRLSGTYGRLADHFAAQVEARLTPTAIERQWTAKAPEFTTEEQRL